MCAQEIKGLISYNHTASVVMCCCIAAYMSAALNQNCLYQALYCRFSLVIIDHMSFWFSGRVPEYVCIFIVNILMC